MQSPQEFIVSEELGGARLDRAVATVLGCSRRLARIAIGEGRVTLNGRPARILTREVRAGQRLCVVAAATAADAPASSAQASLVEKAPDHFWERRAKAGDLSLRSERRASDVTKAALAIVYIDRWIVVVNKPAGLLSEPDRFGAPSVEEMLPRLLIARGERHELWLVHRLDAGTSGLLMFARRPGVARRLYAAFAAREVHKVYWALAAGALTAPTCAIGPIARVAGTKHGVRDDGKPAQTDFTPLATGKAYTLVEARPTTGRTHQIRVHLSHLGHPIVGDALYGGPRYVRAELGTGPKAAPSPQAATSTAFSDQARLGTSNGGLVHAVVRPLLHARELKLTHPEPSYPQPLILRAPVPADLQACCSAVGLASPG